jgi:hypothetical protein
MSAILEWWADNGPEVMTHAAASAGATIAISVLLLLLRVVRTIAGWVGRAAYFLFISWWVRPLRRWVTGSPW